MSGATWKFVLARSRDLANLGELTQARDRQLQLVLNKSGSLSFNIPMSDPLGQLIYPHEYAVKAYRQGSTGLKLIWSGYVNTVEEDALSDRMTVSCVGWYDRLTKRLLHKETHWEQVDDATIVKDLLAHANLGLAEGEFPADVSHLAMPDVPGDPWTVYWPQGSSPNTPTWIKWGGTRPDGHTGGAPYQDLTTIITDATKTPPKTAARTQPTVPAFQTVIATLMQTFSDTENGYDWWIDPATREFFVYRHRRRVRDDVVFGYRFGPSNVAAFGRQIDGSTLANYGLATGPANLRGQQVSSYEIYDHDTSMSSYGPFEEVYSISDATSKDVLDAYAYGEIALKAYPRQLNSVTPFNWTDQNSVPEPFVEYDLGDQVRFIAKQPPRISINQAVRIFGISVSIDAEGNEKLGQLQIYANS